MVSRTIHNVPSWWKEFHQILLKVSFFLLEMLLIIEATFKNKSLWAQFYEFIFYTSSSFSWNTPFLPSSNEPLPKINKGNCSSKIWVRYHYYNITILTENSGQQIVICAKEILLDSLVWEFLTQTSNLQPTALRKQVPIAGVFLWLLRNFCEASVLKNTCKRLLLFRSSC